jgi:hypothetical protein
MLTEPTLTLADMKEKTGISIAAIQKNNLTNSFKRNMLNVVKEMVVGEYL